MLKKNGNAEVSICEIW